MTSRRAFTLIELLIVIAIILILIAIALPNFLEAQIRAKVAKSKGDMRSLHTALETYYLDWEIYPEESEDHITTSSEGLGLLKLTSPIRYINAIPEDPFAGFDTEASLILYESGGMEVGARNALGGAYRGCRECLITWVMWTQGPNGHQEIWAENPHFDTDRDVRSYSPTNGTKSRGSIYVWGGDPYFFGLKMTLLDRSRMHDPSYQVGLTVDGEVFLHRPPPSLR